MARDLLKMNMLRTVNEYEPELSSLPINGKTTLLWNKEKVNYDSAF
jgi:hypothetical protein